MALERTSENRDDTEAIGASVVPRLRSQQKQKKKKREEEEEEARQTLMNESRDSEGEEGDCKELYATRGKRRKVSKKREEEVSSSSGDSFDGSERVDLAARVRRYLSSK